MKYNIPFIDKLIDDAKESPKAQVGNAWVVAEDISYRGFEGFKERLSWAYQVFKGNARPYRFVKNETDLVLLRKQGDKKIVDNTVKKKDNIEAGQIYKSKETSPIMSEVEIAHKGEYACEIVQRIKLPSTNAVLEEKKMIKSTVALEKWLLESFDKVK